MLSLDIALGEYDFQPVLVETEPDRCGQCAAVLLRTPPKGLLFHASGPIDGGWGIIDFWESRADFDSFAPRIAEGMAAAGIDPQGPPDVKEFRVHEMIGA